MNELPAHCSPMCTFGVWNPKGSFAVPLLPAPSWYLPLLPEHLSRQRLEPTTLRFFSPGTFRLSYHRLTNRSNLRKAEPSRNPAAEKADYALFAPAAAELNNMTF